MAGLRTAVPALESAMERAASAAPEPVGAAAGGGRRDGGGEEPPTDTVEGEFREM
jgi:hypothetical protein